MRGRKDQMTFMMAMLGIVVGLVMISLVAFTGDEEIPDNPCAYELGPLPEATVALAPAVAPVQVANMEEATLTPDTVTATLAPGECIEEHKTAYLPAEVAPQKADIVFAIDLTGSMGGELNNVKVNSINIMNTLRTLIPDTNFGVTSHMDYVGYYEGCGYGNWYGDWSPPYCYDYPYMLNQGLTDDTNAVATAINALPLECGADGPESYTRILYESYADAGVGWRPGAKRILLQWGDNVPHDCNYRLDCGGSGTTGPDPGRDSVAGTADDLDLATVLQGMADNDIVLIALHSGGYLSLWDCYAAKTGGDAFQINSDGTVPGGTDIAEFVASLVEEEVSHIDNLCLEVCTEGFEDWLVSVDPECYSDITLDEPHTFEFDVTICVPDGTEPGEYCFFICLLGDRAVYADQEVCITVPFGCLEVTDKIVESKSRMRYNRRTRVETFDMTLTNVGDDPIDEPVILVVEAISPLGLDALLNEDGTTAGGKPYFDYTAFLDGDGVFTPGETLGPRTWQVSNPTRARWSFSISVWSGCDGPSIP